MGTECGCIPVLPTPCASRRQQRLFRGYAGYRSDNTTVCELLRLGDAWTYEPYERFDVEMPDGSFKSYGRISRSNCTWMRSFRCSR